MTREEIIAALSEPFDPAEIKWKPQSVKGNRALALAYMDARCVMDRLDAVVGVDGWQDEYSVLNDGSVVCKLQVRFGSEWITKMDVGGMSEQPDGGDRMKAAHSDALKRAAVKFGVGRYLYRLPQQWADYDPQRKHFTRPPALPDFARPKGRDVEPQGKPAERRATPAQLMTYARKQLAAADGVTSALATMRLIEESKRYTTEQIAELQDEVDSRFGGGPDGDGPPGDGGEEYP